MVERFLGDRVILHASDCLEVLATLPENSIDSCCTDPPYHLTSIVRRFAATNEADDTITSRRVRERSDGYARLVGGGFMGKVWDGGDIAFRPETWATVYRVLKPGAHLVAFGGTRTYHRLACAIEDAGFEIRDAIMWLYGSGFPKSHDVSKGIDKAAGAEREIVGSYAVTREFKGRNYVGDESYATEVDITAPATAAAREWQGWGTALKPACELIVLARKPLSEGTIAANVLRWRTGALNIDACRVETPGETISNHGETGKSEPTSYSLGARVPMQTAGQALGRWPANIVHDGSDEVLAAFPETTTGDLNRANITAENQIYGMRPKELSGLHFGDSGSAARFFYTAKADSDDRLGSKHPTVKPLDLMQWLVRLVTPRGGTCLDPFAGTGTTGEAAWREGFSAMLIEAETEYQNDIRRRMALALAGPDERIRESIKAKNLPRDDGPLFGGTDLQGGHVRKIYGEFEHDKTGKRYEKPRDDGPLFAPRDDYNASDDFGRSIEEMQ